MRLWTLAAVLACADPLAEDIRRPVPPRSPSGYGCFVNDGRYDFDLVRFRRAIASRRLLPDLPSPAELLDRLEQTEVRRKLVAEAERYGEEMHEARHD